MGHQFKVPELTRTQIIGLEEEKQISGNMEVQYVDGLQIHFMSTYLLLILGQFSRIIKKINQAPR